MFKSNNVKVSLQEVWRLIKTVDEDGSGQLSIVEFKKFLQSEKASGSRRFDIQYNFIVFRELVRNLRGEITKTDEGMPKKIDWDEKR